jgi:RNA-binding protein
MKELVLGGKQRRHLRARGHQLRPLVQIGAGGATEAVARALDQALAHHELVKVRVLEANGDELEKLAAGLSAGTRSAHAQTLGRTLLFYRPHAKAPRIVLPGDAATRTRAKPRAK